MSETTRPVSSRREFLQTTGRITAATTLAGLAVPRVHAAEDNTIQVALVGCGGRGTGAAADALRVDLGPTKLVAVADVFEERVRNSVNNLQTQFAAQVDLPPERQFVGFDAYQKAMDCLKPGDIAIFASPLAFRWVHFAYAVQRGLNVFMEKPLTADGPTSQRMLKTAEESVSKGLKVGVGLMSRHSRALQELHKRVQDGELGDIIAMRGYRMHGPLGSAYSEKWPGQGSELLWQIRNFHSFLWASGGCFNDFYIHIVDHCCWMKNAWPVTAQAVGGRHYRGNCIDQNFDAYAVEYTFADGTKFFMDGRCMAGCENIYSSHLHGSKGSAIASRNGDCGPPSTIYKGQNPDLDNRIWESKDRSSPYANEWQDLMDAIRNDKPYNEAEYGILASVASSLGRKAAHTGQVITFDEMLNSDHEYAPGVDKLTMDSPAPLPADAEGKYPIPQPGMTGDREY